MVQFEAQSQHLPSGALESHEKLKSRQPVSKLRTKDLLNTKECYVLNYNVLLGNLSTWATELETKKLK
jgi:hypothetical protein